ncbi:MAG TPA: hypothetical protein DHV48_10960 [Prolixibacteraceae bacterium]|nr:hypothetical protein [Prolixibacteraceae bacterium]
MIIYFDKNSSLAGSACAGSSANNRATFEKYCCGESPAGRLNTAKGYFSGYGFLPGLTEADFLE